VFKIIQDTTLERFGSTINSSVFDAANITGSLKQKGLIDFTAYYPGPNSIVLTDVGKKLKEDAEAKSAAPIDRLDDEILKQMSGGKRFPLELQNGLNLRPMDLAFRLYKLFKQNLLSYELKNGNVEIMLTEQGFLKAKTPTVVQIVQPQGEAPQQGTQVQAQQAGTPLIPGQQAAAPGQAPPEIKVPKKGVNKIIFALTVVTVVVVIGLLVLQHYYLQPPII
jgi:hypothetical protein